MLMWFILLMGSGNDGSGDFSDGHPVAQDTRRRRRIPRVRIRRG